LGFGIPYAELTIRDGLHDIPLGCHFRATSRGTRRKSMAFIVKFMIYVVKNYNPVCADPE
jgi:hypothetical protein